MGPQNYVDPGWLAPNGLLASCSPPWFAMSGRTWVAPNGKFASCSPPWFTMSGRTWYRQTDAPEMGPQNYVDPGWLAPND